MLFLDQVNPSSDPSEILILRFHKPRASLPPLTISVKFYPSQLEPLFNTILIMVFIGFSILSYSIQPHAYHHKYWIHQTISQAQPIRFNIKLYTDHNTLCVKHVTHEQAESLRAASLSKLDNTVNNNSIFNTKYAEFFTKWQVLLYFHNPTCGYNHSYNLHQKSFPLPTLVNFHVPIQYLLFKKIILKIPANAPFLSTSAIFYLPIVA